MDPTKTEDSPLNAQSGQNLPPEVSEFDIFEVLERELRELRELLEPVVVLERTTELGQIWPQCSGHSAPTSTPSSSRLCRSHCPSVSRAKVPRNVELRPRWARTVQLLLALPPRL